MGDPQLFLPLHLAASPSCCVYGFNVTFCPSTPTRLALRNLPPSTQFKFHLIRTHEALVSRALCIFPQLNGNNWIQNRPKEHLQHIILDASSCFNICVCVCVMNVCVWMGAVDAHRKRPRIVLGVFPCFSSSLHTFSHWTWSIMNSQTG